MSKGKLMTRNRASAKKAGSSFERLIADYLKIALNDTRIDRKVRTGAKDTGDIANVKTIQGGDVTLELKDYGGQFKVTEWLKEAEVERINSRAEIGVVIAKRRGVTSPDKQVAFMTVETLAYLLGGTAPFHRDYGLAKEVGE
jgi:hypothetical protein